MKSPESHTLSAALAASSEHASEDAFGGSAAATPADAGRRGILIRVSPELRRELKRTAIARDTTVQALVLKAIAIVLEEPGTTFTP
jgi:hypothetical protein